MILVCRVVDVMWMFVLAWPLSNSSFTLRVGSGNRDRRLPNAVAGIGRSVIWGNWASNSGRLSGFRRWLENVGGVYVES